MEFPFQNVTFSLRVSFSYYQETIVNIAIRLYLDKWIILHGRFLKIDRTDYGNHLILNIFLTNYFTRTGAL